MADTQGKFCKAEAAETIKAVEEILAALSRAKKSELLGHFNDVFLFLRAAQDAAPEVPK
ncbi:MAG TPA: hypothetical protein VNM34_14970 [Verrucomicrobiae bacterium]|nr:hypothetical protein [Verrucomicrobiae bacterium]